MTSSPLKRFRRLVNNESGAALMMALFTVVMLWIIASEIMYETNVEFVVSSHSVNQVRAHYAAKAGVEISLLRLQIYRKVAAALGENANQFKMIDMIWQMPFAWPPIVPEETNSVDKDQIQSAVKTSIMTGQYVATIESESSKIDLSMLASDNPELAKRAVQQLNQIFAAENASNEDFARKYTGVDLPAVVTNIKDWVDADSESDAGRDEKSLYTNIGEGDKFPPNAPFKTLPELHMVAGMTDELYDLLAAKVTIYGAAAINVKYAPKGVLIAAFGLSEEQATRLLTERDKKDTGILKSASDFLSFIEGLGVRRENLYQSGTDKPLVNILVEPEFNFRIHSTGMAGKVKREITAIVYDYNRVLDQLKTYKPTPTPTPIPPGAPGTAPPQPTPTPKPTPRPVPNERPNIVYWNES